MEEERVGGEAGVLRHDFRKWVSIQWVTFSNNISAPFYSNTQCSATCGKGTRMRYVSCRDEDGSVADESACATLPRPVAKEECSVTPCGQWKAMDWSPVSKWIPWNWARTRAALRKMISHASQRPLGTVLELDLVRELFFSMYVQLVGILAIHQEMCGFKKCVNQLTVCLSPHPVGLIGKSSLNWAKSHQNVVGLESVRSGREKYGSWKRASYLESGCLLHSLVT